MSSEFHRLVAIDPHDDKIAIITYHGSLKAAQDKRAYLESLGYRFPNSIKRLHATEDPNSMIFQLNCCWLEDQKELKENGY